ncbi:MAG TPA: DNA starvation/stationary phase protection protein [Solirubrobacteraceae bacterium]|jgi:starvation-inducible DNA-binding protein
MRLRAGARGGTLGGMTHVLSQDHHPTLRHPDREALGADLQRVLVALIDLSLIGKHAHWNVVGPNFRSLHLQLDEMIDEWRDAADAVGERAVALGHAPDGRSATVAERSELHSLEAGPQRDQELIGALTAILTDAIGLIRERMDRLEDVDTVTADLLHGVVATLEKQVWMIRVQAA